MRAQCKDSPYGNYVDCVAMAHIVYITSFTRCILQPPFSMVFSSASVHLFAITVCFFTKAQYWEILLLAIKSCEGALCSIVFFFNSLMIFEVF